MKIVPLYLLKKLRPLDLKTNTWTAQLTPTEVFELWDAGALFDPKTMREVVTRKEMNHWDTWEYIFKVFPTSRLFSVLRTIG